MTDRRAERAPTAGPPPDAVARLRRALRGEVDDAPRRRIEYSSDAGNYRVLPAVVAFPADDDDVAAVLATAREYGLPVTARGGGTSIAGNAVGPGIVVDFSRHLGAVLDVDVAARTAVVQPGVVLSELQQRLQPFGLRFGPDPSSQDRATLGGMIGNNACGPHALRYGRTADNVRRLRFTDGTGRTVDTADGIGAVDGLAALVSAHLGPLRTELGRFSRQLSGYGLEHLLPERGADLAAAFVGSEGTLGLLHSAELRLVPIAPVRTLVVLGYPDMATAADAVPALLPHAPLAVEGLDARLVDAVRTSMGDTRVPPLPAGRGWLLVEVGGTSAAETAAAAAGLVRDAAAMDALTLPAGPAATALWRIRADGAGLAGRSPAGRPAWPGWEDAAVPPEKLGAYLRAFDELLTGHGLTGIPYGHFGDGCVHIRLDLPLDRAPDGDAPARAALRDFAVDAARLVVGFGGSFSGEHGDGRARSELLPLLYSDELISLFGAVKDLFDPDDLLNPGVLVRPAPLDVSLRRPAAHPIPATDGFAFVADGGDLTAAVHRCVGVGACRADLAPSGGFMCPSYQATRDEKDVTRGRARVLQELAIGAGGPQWDSPELQESLELCLACKACASDCPAGVDLARYKSEALHRRYSGRRRPRLHYTLGRLPGWLSALHRLPPLAVRAADRLLRGVRTGPMLLRTAGVDQGRTAPTLPDRSFRQRARPAPATDDRPPVVLWVDSFSDHLAPDAAAAAVTVLTEAGYRVSAPEHAACCGLTWVSTGQLAGAKKRQRRLLDVLAPLAAQGIPIVGLEPSCVATVRGDLPDLLPDDPRVPAVVAAVRTLAEQLDLAMRESDWQPPDLTGTSLLVQPHCHQHAVLGFDTDRRLLASTGAQLSVLAGCCGMAGDFGMQAGQLAISTAVAESALLPAVRAMAPDTILLADGYSCRTQLADLAGVESRTLAQLLADRRR